VGVAGRAADTGVVDPAKVLPVHGPFTCSVLLVLLLLLMLCLTVQHWGLYAVPGFCPVTPSQKTCYAEHFWDTSHRNGSAQNVYVGNH